MSTYTRQLKSQFLANFNHFFAILILSIYPITFFIGTGILNLGVILLDLILIFEIVRIFRDKSADQVSFVFLFSIIIVSSLWLIYGITNNIRAQIISSSTNLILNLILVGLKIKYDT